MSDILLVDRTDRTAVVTLNRPDARNALSRDLRRTIYKTMADLDADDSVDVVILTGADPAFSAGLDLKELAAGDATVFDASATESGTLVTGGPVPPMSKPLIGAVNGVAVTGGFELALACDFLVASERARFADTHARMGIMPGWGLTVLLAEAVGVRRARELSATGNFLDAQTALAWGLVNHVVPHDQLMPTAMQLAADIASNDQPGVRRMMATYDEVVMVTGREAWEIEARVSRDWVAGGKDPADLEARRRAVTERGRTQI